MRKIVFAGLLILFLNIFHQSSVEASISLKSDSFTGKNHLTSDSRKVKPFSQALLMKFFDQKGNSTGYLLALNMFTSKEWWFFSDKHMDAKIDETIFQIPVISSDSEYRAENRPLVLQTTVAMNPDNVISSIQTAKSVTFRVYFKNQPYLDWTVPQELLKEWQTVINLDKNGNPINK